MRLFVSVDLPDDLADAIESLQDELREASGLRFTDPEQAHITLKFLGDVDEDRLFEIEDAIETAVEETGIAPFSARFSGLGAFPSEDYISVVWFGVEQGGDELTHLHEAVEDRTTAIGFEPEDHRFTPHVTVARMDHAGGKDHVQEVLREQDPTIGEMNVDELRLTESNLGSDGPTYSTVTRFPLG